MRLIKYKILLILLIFVGAAITGVLLWRTNHSREAYRYRLPVGSAAMNLEQYAILIQKRLDSTPSNYLDLAALAEVHLTLGQRTGDAAHFAAALEMAQKSLKILAVNNTSAEMVLAHILENQHRFEEAVQSAEKILEHSPNALGPYSILITSHLAKGDLVKAQNFADILVQRSPRTGALALRGLVLISAGRVPEGVFDLEKSLVVEDIGEEADSTWARCILARHFLSRGRVGAADDLLKEALRITPNFPLALDIQAQLRARTGDFKSSEELFDQAFSQSRQIVYLRHAAELDQMTGRLELANDRWGQAEKLIRLDLDQGLYGHRLELAKILFRRAGVGDFKQALELCLAEQSVRQSADSHFMLASIYFALGETKPAAEFVLKALRTVAHESRVYALSSSIFQSMGLTERAYLYYKLARETDPDFNSSLSFL